MLRWAVQSWEDHGRGALLLRPGCFDCHSAVEDVDVANSVSVGQPENGIVPEVGPNPPNAPSGLRGANDEIVEAQMPVNL